MLVIDSRDRVSLINDHREKLRKHGFTPPALGWTKGKQDVRFSVLLDCFEIKGKTILDIGCGFGDFLKYLPENTQYIGLDIVSEFIEEARTRYANCETARFYHSDFLDDDFKESADIAIASGSFNYRLDHTNSYEYIERAMNKAFLLTREAIAFNFLSSKVDYELEHAFHCSPEKILTMAYNLSRNILLRNDYMPFEFTIVVFKDDSFEKSDTMFCRYKKQRQLD